MAARSLRLNLGQLEFNSEETPADLYNDRIVYLTGALDDIRLYPHDLSPNEVQQLFVETP